MTNKPKQPPLHRNNRVLIMGGITIVLLIVLSSVSLGFGHNVNVGLPGGGGGGTPRPILHYNFNGTNVVGVHDYASGHRDGTLHGPSWVSDSGHDRKGAYEFKRNENDWIEGPDLDIADSFSILMWVNPRVLLSGQTFIGKHTLGGENLILFGLWREGNENRLTSRYHVRIRDESVYFNTSTTGWQHLALVGRKVGDKTHVYIYKNGNLLNDRELNTVVGDVSGKGWTIGQEWDRTRGGEVVESDYFDGFISEVQIFSRALTQAQIVEYKNKVREVGQPVVGQLVIGSEPPELCTGGVDEDDDTLIDCADAQCDNQACGEGCTCFRGFKKETTCDDGIDNDGNNEIDCADASCDGNAVCELRNINTCDVDINPGEVIGTFAAGNTACGNIAKAKGATAFSELEQKMCEHIYRGVPILKFQNNDKFMFGEIKLLQGVQTFVSNSNPGANCLTYISVLRNPDGSVPGWRDVGGRLYPLSVEEAKKCIDSNPAGFAQFIDNSCPAPQINEGDFNRDGCVNLQDFWAIIRVPALSSLYFDPVNPSTQEQIAKQNTFIQNFDLTCQS